MDNARLQKAIDLVNKATEKDEAGDYEAALKFYKASLENWQVVCKYQPNVEIREKLYQKMEPYMARAESIREFLNHKRPSSPVMCLPSSPESVPVIPSRSSRRICEYMQRKSPPVTKDDERDKFNTKFLALATMEKPNVLWDDVVGLDKAKEALQEATLLPLKFPEHFADKLQPWRGILLYGPPGTGKTHLARACASASSGTFLSVSSADLLSKWQGESEKLVRSLFDVARERAPCTIFIDEVDSLCSDRSTGESDGTRRVKTELLVQMDGLRNNQSKSILVLGATNAPWDLDVAIRRRFERRIHVPVPDRKARRQLFEKLALGTGLCGTDLDALADATEDFSAADVTVAWRDCRMAPLRRCRNATHWIMCPNGKFSPCDPGTAGSVERTLFSLGPDQLQPPAVTREDALLAVKNTKKATDEALMQRYADWTAKFGLMGS